MFKKIFYMVDFIFPQSCFTIGVVKTEHRGDGMDNEQLWNKFLTQIQIKILEQSILKNWTDIYPYKEENNYAGYQGNAKTDLSKYDRW